MEDHGTVSEFNQRLWESESERSQASTETYNVHDEYAYALHPCKRSTLPPTRIRAFMV